MSNAHTLNLWCRNELQSESPLLSPINFRKLVVISLINGTTKSHNYDKYHIHKNNIEESTVPIYAKRLKNDSRGGLAEVDEC